MHRRSRVVWADLPFGLLLMFAANARSDEVDVQPTADAAAPAATDTTVAKAPNADPMVCRSMIVTGTRIASRVCKPASEWSTLTRNSKNALDGLQRSGDMQHQHSN